MPTKIKQARRNFEQDIGFVRMNCAELIAVLKRLDVIEENVVAISNGSDFRGLDDIKSEPARFAGQPQLVISRSDARGRLATANIFFQKSKTTITAGQNRGRNKYNDQDDEFAQSLFSELSGFASPLEKWASATVGYAQPSIVFVWAVICLSLIIADSEEKESLLTSEYSAPIFLSMVIIPICIQMAHWCLQKRVPVSFNPRKSFIQKHGESIVVGAIMVVITALASAIFDLP